MDPGLPIRGIHSTVWLVLAVIATMALAAAGVVAQTTAGAMAGRITDEGGGALPSVRITIADGRQSREVLTDADGRFAVPSLPLGRYRVSAELASFTTVSGDVTLTASVPRAFVTWSLKVGCLGPSQRVIFSVHDAAPLVESIVHLRVDRVAGPVTMSVRPDCDGQVLQEYSARLLRSAPGRAQTDPGPMRVFMEPRDAPLALDQEYIALLWPGGYTTENLVLPIVSGLVRGPYAGPLDGLSLQEAMDLLGKWADGR